MSDENMIEAEGVQDVPSEAASAPNAAGDSPDAVEAVEARQRAEQDGERARANREAAKYRTKLRAAEAERARLAAELEAEKARSEAEVKAFAVDQWKAQVAEETGIVSDVLRGDSLDEIREHARIIAEGIEEWELIELGREYREHLRRGNAPMVRESGAGYYPDPSKISRGRASWGDILRGS